MPVWVLGPKVWIVGRNARQEAPKLVKQSRKDLSNVEQHLENLKKNLPCHCNESCFKNGPKNVTLLSCYTKAQLLLSQLYTMHDIKNN